MLLRGSWVTHNPKHLSFLMKVTQAALSCSTPCFCRSIILPAFTLLEQWSVTRCLSLRRFPVSSDAHHQSQAGHGLMNDAACFHHVSLVCEDEGCIVCAQQAAQLEQLSLCFPALPKVSSSTHFFKVTELRCVNHLTLCPFDF